MRPEDVRTVEKTFKERIDKATTLKQVSEAVRITIGEYIKTEPQQKEFLDTFSNTVLLLQGAGLSLKEQYILAFGQTCADIWGRLEKAEDGKAVSFFANSMRERLTESSDKGKRGWWRDDTPIEVLYEGLLKAVTELRYVDIANYAMMLEYHKRAYGREVKKRSRLLDELDEAIAQHNNTVFAVRNPPLSLGILAAREKILRKVQGLDHEVYMMASNAVNCIVQAGIRNRADEATVGSVNRALNFLRRLLNES